MAKKKTILISPSGKLYGSEQVLLEYLKKSKTKKIVYIPGNSPLQKYLNSKSFVHKTFKSLTFLYFKIFIMLLMGRQKMFINEAGHIRYVKVLASILPHKRFFVFVRLLEDCNFNRIKNTPANVSFIAVSNFLKQQLPEKIPATVIHDPYTLENKCIEPKKKNTTFSIGIIGRITPTKGLNELPPILKHLSNKVNEEVDVYFWGSYNKSDNWTKEFIKEVNQIPNIRPHFKGFQKDKSLIFEHFDILLHLSKVEALGRVIFESIDYNTPFLAFDNGGSAELAKKLKLNNLLIPEEGNWSEAFSEKLFDIKNNNSKYLEQLQESKKIIREHFSAKAYADKVDSLL